MTITYTVAQWRHIGARIAGTEPARQHFGLELQRIVKTGDAGAVQRIEMTRDEAAIVRRAAESLNYTEGKLP